MQLQISFDKDLIENIKETLDFSTNEVNSIKLTFKNGSTLLVEGQEAVEFKEVLEK